VSIKCDTFLPLVLVLVDRRIEEGPSYVGLFKIDNGFTACIISYQFAFRYECKLVLLHIRNTAWMLKAILLMIRTKIKI